MPRVLVNGASIHVEDSGAGAETVLFAHGLLWSGEMFRPQLEAFQNRFRCVTMDFRGQGRSELVPSGYDMDTLTGDALGVIDKLGLGPVHFVGLSMGGFVGMRLAARRPELIRSLALLETAADVEPRINVPKYKAMTFLARFVGFSPFAGTVMKIMFGEAFLRDPARAAELEALRQELLALNVIGVGRAVDGVIFRKPIAGELSRIRAPTLVLHGEGDRAIARPRSRAMAEAIPGARFVLLPRAGHTSTLEEPQAVNAALREFWDSLPGQ